MTRKRRRLSGEQRTPLPVRAVNLLAGIAPGVDLGADDLPAGVAEAEATTPATPRDRGRQARQRSLAGAHQSVALPRRDRALRSVSGRPPVERRRARLDEVEHVRFQADVVEAVDLLDAGRARDVDLGQ